MPTTTRSNGAPANQSPISVVAVSGSLSQRDELERAEDSGSPQHCAAPTSQRRLTEDWKTTPKSKAKSKSKPPKSKAVSSPKQPRTHKGSRQPTKGTGPSARQNTTPEQCALVAGERGPDQVAWEGLCWRAVSGVRCEPYDNLQQAWMPVFLTLFMGVKVEDPQFFNLMSHVRVLDFHTPLLFELKPTFRPGVRLALGSVEYLRISMVPHARSPADATIVEVDAHTVVLRGQTRFESNPILPPHHDGPLRSELAIVPRPTSGKFPRVVLHLSHHMAEPEAYSFLRDTDELVLIVNELQKVDPTLLADLLALTLIPQVWLRVNSFPPVESGSLHGQVPHLILVGDGPLSKQQTSALTRRFRVDQQEPMLAAFICPFADQTYGREELQARCDILSHGEYQEKIGREASVIEMGEHATVA